MNPASVQSYMYIYKGMPYHMHTFTRPWNSIFTTSMVPSPHIISSSMRRMIWIYERSRDFAFSSHHHSLQPSHIAFLCRNFKVPVDNATILLAQIFKYLAAKHNWDSTHVTASSIPVPEPKAPKRSLATDRAPIHAPPNAAAVGMILLSSLYMLCSRCPAMTSPCSLSCFATSRGAEPLTSIQVFEKIAHAVNINTT